MKRVRTPLILVSALLFLVACGAGQGADGGAGGSVKRDPSPLDYVRLSKGPCFGACPIFNLKLFGDGKVEFFGERFTKSTGQTLDHSSVSRFLSVLDALNERDFTSFEPDYSGKACTVQTTDHPTIVIEMKSGDTHKTVRWNTGCRGNDDLVRLERLVRDLDWLMEVETYIGTDEERMALWRKRR